MRLEKFSGSGSTPKRRKFWDKVVEVVNASQKRQGKNVSIDVHEGYGSVINVNPQRQKPSGGNPCSNLEAPSINLRVEGVVSCPGDFECIDVNGDWVLPFFDSGTWELDQEFDCGPFPLTIAFIVDCNEGLFNVTIVAGGSAYWFISATFATWPASQSNDATCADGNPGEGGTAGISLP